MIILPSVTLSAILTKTKKRITFGFVSVDAFHSNIGKVVEIFTGTELHAFGKNSRTRNEINIKGNEGVSFLRNCGAVSVAVKHKNLVLSTEWIKSFATLKD